ncbi:hypothetical protein OH76DRAFT_1481531 [Lentinus brumalis]|uniref:DUF6533 domain-containing protein n=1 Tax=Lentinus brumalis TaxID=2498619 RepID=A0A371DFE0_9APHY|nr:hypothetical protein OH76DRAFT_1481531 [Polyporus brumalis]
MTPSTTQEDYWRRIYRTAQDENFQNSSVTAFVFFDYFLTFGNEVNLFWSRKLSGASALFYATRYLNLALHVLYIHNTLHNREFSTKYLIEEVEIFSVLSFQIVRYIPIAIFTGLRGYALSRNGKLAATIFVLSFSPVAANVAQWVLGTSALVQPYGCVAEVSVTDLQYIIILFILNAVHIVLLLQTLLSGTAIAETSYMTRYTDPITTVLTYRFLIDLQKSNQQDVKLGSDDPLHIAVDSTGSLSFVERALGSIGATIDLRTSVNSDSDKDDFFPKTSVHESDAGNGTMGPLDVMEEARFVGEPLSIAGPSRPIEPGAVLDDTQVASQTGGMVA